MVYMPGFDQSKATKEEFAMRYAHLERIRAEDKRHSVLLVGNDTAAKQA